MTQEVLNLDFKSFHIASYFRLLHQRDTYGSQCWPDIVPKQNQHFGEGKARFQYGRKLKGSLWKSDILMLHGCFPFLTVKGDSKWIICWRNVHHSLKSSCARDWVLPVRLWWKPKFSRYYIEHLNCLKDVNLKKNLNTYYVSMLLDHWVTTEPSSLQEDKNHRKWVAL